MTSQRAQFSATMLDIMERDEQVCVLLADIGVYAFREHMERWPLRCVNCGISEQAIVSMAAGMAASGLYPVVSSIDSFIARRAYEQVRLDFGEQRLAGLFVTVGHDYDYRALGPSHHNPEGATLMSFVRGMKVLEPESAEQVALGIQLAASARQLAYMRLKEQG